MNEDFPLRELRRGELARIAAIETDDASLREQLDDHGFRPGEDIELMAYGPFGGVPVAVRLGRAMVALRSLEAAAIRVRRA
ncbi:MAG: FeoA family protein [Parvularcula sp.]|jgi:ferrous iron transport protein A|nr:FeoA family protein [Parvularcula sp.]